MARQDLPSLPNGNPGEMRDAQGGFAYDPDAPWSLYWLERNSAKLLAEGYNVMATWFESKGLGKVQDPLCPSCEHQVSGVIDEILVQRFVDAHLLLWEKLGEQVVLRWKDKPFAQARCRNCGSCLTYELHGSEALREALNEPGKGEEVQFGGRVLRIFLELRNIFAMNTHVEARGSA